LTFSFVFILTATYLNIKRICLRLGAKSTLSLKVFGKFGKTLVLGLTLQNKNLLQKVLLACFLLSWRESDALSTFKTGGAGNLPSISDKLGVRMG